MPVLQKLLRNMFGYAAIISAGVFATMVPVLLRSPFPHATARFNADPYGLLLIFMRELIMLAPPFVTIVNAVAWLTLRKGSRSARPWAIAASISFLVLSAPFLVAGVVILQYHLTGFVGFAGVLILFLILSAVGIAGVAAFAKRDAMSVSCISRPTVASNTRSVGTLASAA
ncbi:hypothetical protein P8935_06845 [Telmatobacter sp. DSM 110680]|uniref:Uncharacterized protein n=1 Tax=Telmatobacter sp. DSM 110680 TaxID=3036704 RepID=A0AAU7DLK5_9BACT